MTLVRHGRSRADDERVHEGRYDSPLTKAGRQQAEARAKQWRQAGLGVDRLLASPLVRASETAAILGAALGLEVTLAPAWLERDNGVLAGMDFGLAQETHPERSFTGPFERKGVVGESNWALQQRAAAAVEEIIQLGERHVLVVAHGGIINAALRTIVGAPPAPENQGLRFLLGDLGYVRLRYEPRTDTWLFIELAPGLERD